MDLLQDLKGNNSFGDNIDTLKTSTCKESLQVQKEGKSLLKERLKNIT